MSYKIEEIEGIGPAYAEKLAAAGIANTDDLLKKCATPAGRKAAAEASGLSAAVILKWCNMADLMRVSGIGPQFAELLKASGVDTIKELRNRNAANLATKMAEVNAEKKLARTSPAESLVTKWVEQAKEMQPLLSY
jgi:predicted flap endonuclease-1-like 5' DNA nuclease